MRAIIPMNTEVAYLKKRVSAEQKIWETLHDAAKGGDIRALNQIVGMLNQFIFRYASTQLGLNRVEAESFASEITVNYSMKYKDIVAIRCWVLRASMRKRMDYLRQLYRNKREISIEGIPERKYPAQDEHENNINRLDIERMLKRLNPHEQLVIQYIFFEEMRIRDVSKTLGKTESAIKMTLYRSLVKLRNIYDPV